MGFIAFVALIAFVAFFESQRLLSYKGSRNEAQGTRNESLNFFRF